MSNEFTPIVHLVTYKHKKNSIFSRQTFKKYSIFFTLFFYFDNYVQNKSIDIHLCSQFFLTNNYVYFNIILYIKYIYIKVNYRE